MMRSRPSSAKRSDGKASTKKRDQVPAGYDEEPAKQHELDEAKEEQPGLVSMLMRRFASGERTKVKPEGQSRKDADKQRPPQNSAPSAASRAKSRDAMLAAYKVCHVLIHLTVGFRPRQQSTRLNG